MTRKNSGTPSRTRSATGSGTSPPGSSATPGRGSSRSVRTGPGKKPSSPAGTGCAPSLRPADQRKPSRRHGRKSIPARWKPVPTRARRAVPHTTRQKRNGHEAQKPAPARTVTKDGQPDSLRLKVRYQGAQLYEQGMTKLAAPLCVTLKGWLIPLSCHRRQPDPLERSGKLERRARRAPLEATALRGSAVRRVR
jgi:hypothetical protein